MLRALSLSLVLSLSLAATPHPDDSTIVERKVNKAYLDGLSDSTLSVLAGEHGGADSSTSQKTEAIEFQQARIDLGYLAGLEDRSAESGDDINGRHRQFQLTDTFDKPKGSSSTASAWSSSKSSESSSSSSWDTSSGTWSSSSSSESSESSHCNMKCGAAYGIVDIDPATDKNNYYIVQYEKVSMDVEYATALRGFDGRQPAALAVDPKRARILAIDGDSAELVSINPCTGSSRVVHTIDTYMWPIGPDYTFDLAFDNHYLYVLHHEKATGASDLLRIHFLENGDVASIEPDSLPHAVNSIAVDPHQKILWGSYTQKAAPAESTNPIGLYAFNLKLPNYPVLNSRIPLQLGAQPFRRSNPTDAVNDFNPAPYSIVFDKYDHAVLYASLQSSDSAIARSNGHATQFYSLSLKTGRMSMRATNELWQVRGLDFARCFDSSSSSSPTFTTTSSSTTRIYRRPDDQHQLALKAKAARLEAEVGEPLDVEAGSEIRRSTSFSSGELSAKERVNARDQAVIDINYRAGLGSSL